MSAIKNNRSRNIFLFVIAVFVLPVALAKLALEFQWFNYGVTNHGELLEQPTSLKDLALSDKAIAEQWLVVYVLPEECDKLCQQALTTMNSSYVLLGKEIPRVTPIALSKKPLSEKQSTSLSHSKWQRWQITQQASAVLLEGQVVVIDPLGNLVMTHKTPASSDALVTMGKAVLADMKKLLKYSRVG